MGTKIEARAPATMLERVVAGVMAMNTASRLPEVPKRPAMSISLKKPIPFDMIENVSMASVPTATELDLDILRMLSSDLPNKYMIVIAFFPAGMLEFQREVHGR